MAWTDSTTRRLVTAFLCVAVPAALAPSAAAFRDCCIGRSVPPQLSGVAISGPADAILGSLERLGFEPVDGAIPGLGNVLDVPPEAGRLPGFAGFPVGGVTPTFHRFELACGPPVPFVPGSMFRQPNGAFRLVRVTALASDLDRACEAIEAGFPGPYGVPGFGSEFELLAIGARARESRMIWGVVRVIAPARADGPAARWLGERGPAWIGFAVESDIAATEQFLGRSGIAFGRGREIDGRVVWVAPADAAGMLVEFVDRERR